MLSGDGVLTRNNVIYQPQLIHQPIFTNLKTRRPQGCHHSISRDGGGVFFADKCFILTRLGGALKIFFFFLSLYGTILIIYYLFNTYFSNILQPPPPPLVAPSIQIYIAILLSV